METGVKDYSLDDIKSLEISSLDEDEEQTQEEDDNDDDDEDDGPVTLGFLEKPSNLYTLLRQYFPSKAGGVPAWLDPVDLPSEQSCLCDICREPLQFLLQVYAPLTNTESTFHRTLFVFMCTSMTCLLQDQREQWKRRPEKLYRSVKVFRSQLTRSNPFYSSDPPMHDKTDKPPGIGAALCHWCGTWKGDKVCSSCKGARYCSGKHQVMHWRSGHKIDCQRMNVPSRSSLSNNKTISTEIKIGMFASNALWPEFEIISEEECEFDTEESECNQSNALTSEGQKDETIDSLSENFKGDDDKRSWASFQARLAKAPEQVLRYSRGVEAKPLWPVSSGRLSNTDIPKCKYCDGPMCCELQILPQLLYYFGVKNEADSLDWATIVVYTCEGSCEASVSYREEFAWVQLPSLSHAVP
ncbi:hypothetical protein GIB67_022814 [Kingdonia uniflora]|uniref:MYND-type domain-containing protein n=1 Tax=Kingdonia uniflora TaxID=39325 RepID=A0A7J7P729_9MAGN|nr:hypothetical protein GIB67_022814 [Kingdonia uniflora]